jgi:hypothetical protein
MPEPAVVKIIGGIGLPKWEHIVRVPLVDWSKTLGSDTRG